MSLGSAISCGRKFSTGIVMAGVGREEGAEAGGLSCGKHHALRGRLGGRGSVRVGRGALEREVKRGIRGFKGRSP
jgi:hypothetical protein